MMSQDSKFRGVKKQKNLKKKKISVDQKAVGLGLKSQ